MNHHISIVLPVFNEQENIPLVYQALTDVLTQLPTYTYELIFVDDGSHDASWSLLTKLAAHDNHIRALRFTRNFGHQIALTAGYDKAQGDIIISMDADLQHPPEIIPEMIKAWEQGAHIVYARRIDRQDTWLKKITALMYYRFINKIADVSMPRNVADFRLIDKTVLRTIQSSQEHSRYLRGMIAWTGFTSAFVDFKCKDRIHGHSGYTWKKMFKLAFDGITGFSTFPLKIAAYAGFFVMATGSLMFLYITYDELFRNVHYPLFKWLVTIIYIFMGIQFTLLWLLGEYIGRIYDQLRNRPLYIVAQEIEQKEPIASQPSMHITRPVEFSSESAR